MISKAGLQLLSREGLRVWWWGVARVLFLRVDEGVRFHVVWLVHHNGGGRVLARKQSVGKSIILGVSQRTGEDERVGRGCYLLGREDDSTLEVVCFGAWQEYGPFQQ